MQHHRFSDGDGSDDGVRYYNNIHVRVGGYGGCVGARGGRGTSGIGLWRSKSPSTSEYRAACSVW